MKFGGSDFSSAINNIVTEITNAQEFINVNGTKFLKEVHTYISYHVRFIIENYISFFIYIDC